MKPYEIRHLIAEFPDLTWEEIIEVHEGRAKHRIDEQKQKLDEARKMAKGVIRERHSFGLMSGARLYINKFAPYEFWYEDLNGEHHGCEQEAVKANARIAIPGTATAESVIARLKKQLADLRYAASNVINEWPDINADKPSCQKSPWSVFAVKLQALEAQIDRNP